MGRLVEPRPQTELTRSGATPEGNSGWHGDVTSPTRMSPAGDGYAGRVAKYIPGEIVATYLSIIGILKTVDPSDQQRIVVGWIVFGLCVVLTPIYFYMQAQKDRPKILHMCLSTIAFSVWAYALGGVFEMTGIYKPWIGSLALACVTLVSGLLVPEDGDK